MGESGGGGGGSRTGEEEVIEGASWAAKQQEWGGLLVRGEAGRGKESKSRGALLGRGQEAWTPLSWGGAGKGGRGGASGGSVGKEATGRGRNQEAGGRWTCAAFALSLAEPKRLRLMPCSASCFSFSYCTLNPPRPMLITLSHTPAHCPHPQAAPCQPLLLRRLGVHRGAAELLRAGGALRPNPDE